MHSLWSKIIWEKLGLNEYEIHSENYDKTKDLIKNWIENNDIKEIENVLTDLACFKIHDCSDYYDGNIHTLVDPDDISSTFFGFIDLQVLPMLVYLMSILTNFSEEDWFFFKDIVKIIQDKQKYRITDWKVGEL